MCAAKPHAPGGTQAVSITNPGGTIVLGEAVTVGCLDGGDKKSVIAKVQRNRQAVSALLVIAAEERLPSVHEVLPRSQANEALKRVNGSRTLRRADLVPGS